MTKWELEIIERICADTTKCDFCMSYLDLIKEEIKEVLKEIRPVSFNTAQDMLRFDRTVKEILDKRGLGGGE